MKDAKILFLPLRFCGFAEVLFNQCIHGKIFWVKFYRDVSYFLTEYNYLCNSG